jgi:dolichyl-diphosphooligosaccharide---protein glycosyltransferase
MDTTSSGGSDQRAVILTTRGAFEIELYPKAAPKTVTNFLNLASSGFYDNLVWHRIVKGFALQVGDPTTRNGGGEKSRWGSTGSTNTVPLETNSSLVRDGYVNDLGYLGMARTSDPNSGSSQFYINLANNSFLNGQYTVFGKVVSGMDVIDALSQLPVNANDQPINAQEALLIRVTIQGTR